MKNQYEIRSLASAAILVPALALAQPSVQRPPRQGWTLDIHPGSEIALTLRAADVPLSELAADLSKQLKLPVTVAPAVRQTAVTVAIEHRRLEEALPLLAPQVRVYADYELTATESSSKPIAIFFQSDDTDAQSNATDVPPLPVGNAASEIHVVSGNTEDGEPTAPGAPSADASAALFVKLENQLLTVRARQQPLIGIVYAVAGQLGASVSVAMQTPSLQQLLTAPADVQLDSADIETSVLGLSPAVRLYVRRDLQTAEARILRITLVEP